MKITKSNPPGRFRYEWDEIVAAAKASPDEWISPDQEYLHSTVTALMRGKNSKFPTSEFTFRTSNTRHNLSGQRLCTMHVRYTPTEESNR